MPNQTARQQARRAALDAQTRMRQARAERERRRSALAVTVVTALAERDALVTACEARAGEALRTLTGAEGLTLREAVQWCGGDEQLGVREATRLRKVRVEPAEPESEPNLSAPGGEAARARDADAAGGPDAGGSDGAGRGASR